ncbi:hypothetical protein DAI22_11g188350 [Oryza sativa Japonica Group]|nr:hypothetical protein DAI22_11g188350 [Oryza sativa Japonica Group]
MSTSYAVLWVPMSRTVRSHRTSNFRALAYFGNEQAATKRNHKLIIP